MSSIVAMSATTPIRSKGDSFGMGAGDDGSRQEGPLPNIADPMHEVLRQGRLAGQGQSSLFSSYRREEHARSSSPSSRAFASASTSGSRSSGLRPSRSPTSLAASMGAMQQQQYQRNALGSQMGILQSSISQSTNVGVLNVDSKSSRPGALGSVSQRSVSYETSSTQKGPSEEGILKMTSRASHLSLAASAATSSSAHASSGNKENLVDGGRGLSAASSSGHSRRTSAARRVSTRRSPSPTAVPALQEEDVKPEYSSHRRSSAESDKKEAAGANGAIVCKASGDVALSGSRRQMEEDAASKSPRQYAAHDLAPPGMSQYVTPGLSGAARVLRGGHPPAKHVVAPWSVGRSIKRIDRHNAPDKPPQRIVASQEEEEEEEDDEADDGGLIAADADEVAEMQRDQQARAAGPKYASRWREGSRPQLQIQEEDEEDMRQMGNNRASPQDHPHSGSDGSNRTPPLSVPLGADEDEEEDDFVQDHHRSSAQADSFPLSVRRNHGPAAPSRDDPAARRHAIQDILAAKIPQVSNRRAVEGGPVLNQPASRDVPLAMTTLPLPDREPKADFMSQVRQEALRQRGRDHMDRLNGRPSKDLETKFNGYKFKKVRKAGEGGFSTVWQVRGPFAAPDPQQPGNYIDVPESEQAYFAMKQVTLKKMEKISREEVLEECNLLQSLAGKRNNEDFILRFFGWKSSPGSLKILLELGEHDFNHILREGRLSRHQIKEYWHQMLEAVHFTHEEGNIVHTDLKPANFLMANGRLKLIDFGIAQKIPVGTIHIKRDAMIGTPNYMAPETVKAVKEAKREGRDARVYKAGKASDVWALGCIFYQMVYDRPPFEAFHGDEKLKEILDPRHIIRYPTYRPIANRSSCSGSSREGDGHQGTDNTKEGMMERVDEDVLDVMQLTFIYSPQDRITIPQLLRHRFLGSHASTARVNENDDDETVPISRGTLKEILRKIYAFTRTGELLEDDLDERGDTLFDNIRDKHNLAAS